MSEYNKYLAASIYTEQKIVTYRLLSRALKIHVNSAKEILYEFHREQNARKPESIHAVYLVSGIKAEKVVTDIPKYNTGECEEDYIQSSASTNSQFSFLDEGASKSLVETITLVREQDLMETQSRYEKINSIHVYSIGPYLVKDLQVLSDVSREVKELCSNENHLETCSTYGIIQNKNVKCRNGSRPLPIVQKLSKKSSAKIFKSSNINDEHMDTVKRQLKATQPTTPDSLHDRANKKNVPVGNINPRNEIQAGPIQSSKHDSTSIARAFARAEPKLKQKQTEKQFIEKGIINMGDDSPMKNASSDDDDTWVPAPGQTEKIDCNIESIEKREKALKKMMNDDIEEQEEVGHKGAPSENVSKSNGQSKPNEACIKIEDQTTIVSDPKKRSRRRVTKKTTFKDEDGYLVTKEEPGWESFSEDERALKPKLKGQSSTANLKPQKGNTGKSGQGNIMSFFGKK